MSNSVKDDLIDTYFADTRTKFKRRKYVLKGINDLIQVDLLDLNKYLEFNNGYRYVLTAINCFTKFAYGRPLKTKTANEVKINMELILNHVFPMVKNIQADQGSEFFNKHFKSLMSKYNINLYHVYTEIKASMIERFHRTLRKLLIKESYKRNSPKWIDFLQDVIQKYNNTIHSVTKYKPSQVGFSQEKILLRRLQPQLTQVKRQPKFKINDYVHISKKKTLFEKGTFNFTPLVFQIRQVVTNDFPITYRLRSTHETNNQDIQGTFYEEELKLAKHGLTYVVEQVLKKKYIKKKPYLYVKWMGFDDKKWNTYIEEKDIIT